MSTVTFPYHSAFTQRYVDQGKSEGLADSVLRALRNRGLPVSAAVEARVRGCRDVSLLSAWFDRAFTVDAAEDVFTD
ncbi:hypothetical protein LX16_3463 [Stackebrandtia albiflava]|uniref:Uncharacterized protein n=1 Tax=Stackebrandtia albiflava TaxID=406432 RepID=A0A562V473_9ACTN|nr:hypothetical protein [Stackebrandtia albiflava]TWJ12699.1 hypothetical protein LX16_3463 [Stackebrandtia albiflava]